jgi:hypothetical protein
MYGRVRLGSSNIHAAHGLTLACVHLPHKLVITVITAIHNIQLGTALHKIFFIYIACNLHAIEVLDVQNAY